MTDETKPASEADVVEAMARAALDACDSGDGWTAAMTATLTAARSLGCLLPEEAAGLREENQTFRDLINGCGIAHKALTTERDTLAARVRVLEEALRAIAAKDRTGFGRPALGRIARAALAQPGEVGT